MAKFGVGDWVIVEGIIPAQITQVNPKLEGHQERFLKKFGWPHTSWYATDKCGLRAESELKRMSNARNSQFKIGDKVRHVDDAKDGPVGIVKGVYGDGRIKVKFPGLMKGGFDGFKEEELVMANVKNAKFKASKTVANSKVVANALISFEELLKKEGLSREEFDKMMKEMKSKGASAVHYMRGKDGRLLFKADGTTIGNGVARNIRAIPVDSKGKGIIERCKIRTADGEVAEVAYIDEDGYVYFEAKDGRIRGVPAKTVVRLNADTSIVSETAVNASDAATRKFKPNDLVEWNDYKGRHNSAYYFRDNGPDRVTVSIYRDGQGGFLEVPRAWITNSCVRNAKFKAGDKAYVHWFSGEDELVDVISYDPKGDYYIVRGEDGQLAHPKSYLLYPVKNASALNAVRVGMKDTNGRDISIGDSIQHIDSKMKGKVVGKFNEHLLLVDWDGGFQEEVHPSDIRITNSRACNSTNAIVRKAMNATALNYSPYAKGAWIHDDKGRNYTVVEEEHWGKDGKAVRLVTIRDEATKQTKEIPVTELSYRFHMGEAESCRKCGNAALNFSPGDKVSIVDTDIRYGGDEGEVVRKDGFRYVIRLTSRLDKPEVTLQPNQLKAANSEDAQGHEHGSDGKFASKGGGSDGGDSYEDPKTKRMKERLAKMREKNEALRKEIDQRKAALAGKKEETEKMRADVMKANVEKWKAGLPKTTNSVVAKALNAVSRNAVAYTNPETSDKVVIKPFAGLWDVRVVPPYFHNLFTAKTKDEAVAWAKANGKTITKIENAVAKNATRARNADYDYDEDLGVKSIFKVGKVYRPTGGRRNWLYKVVKRNYQEIYVDPKAPGDKTFGEKYATEKLLVDTLKTLRRHAEIAGDRWGTLTLSAANVVG